MAKSTPGAFGDIEELLAVEATGRDSPDEWDERMAHHTWLKLFFFFAVWNNADNIIEK